MEEQIENNITEETSALRKPERHHRKPESDRDGFFMLRQIFNIVFMVGAIAGVIVYLKVNDTMGAILIIIAMAFKMAECVLRFRKK